MKDPMSHDEFENYLALLSRMLRLRGGQTEAIAEELRLHLEERLGELTDRGVDPKKAVNIALGEFGDATALADKFTEISRMKRRRVMLRSMVTGVCAAIVGFAALMTVWPESRTSLLNVAQAEPTATEETVTKAPKDTSPKMSQADRENLATREKLKKKIDIKILEEPLGKALPGLGAKNDIQFYFDQNAIENMGRDLDNPISFDMKKIPIEVGLRLMLRDLELSYYLDNGIVMVTSKEVVQTQLSVRMYNVKDLTGDCSSSMSPMMPMACGMAGLGGMGGGSCTGALQAKPADKGGMSGRQDIGAPKAWASPKTDPVVMGGAVGGMPVPANPCAVAPSYGVAPVRGTTAACASRPSDENNSDLLINAIQCVADPESWSEVGGNGSIVCYRGILIVRQTESVHEEVEKLLDQLRHQLKDSPLPTNPPPVSPSPYGMPATGRSPVPVYPYPPSRSVPNHAEPDATEASGSGSGYAPPMPYPRR